MRKFFRYLLIFIIVLLVLIFSISYLYKVNVVNNLSDKKKIVDSVWSELFANSSKRIILLQKLDSHLKNENIVTDSLRIVLENSSKSRNLYKNECSLDFVKQEFDLNKEYLKIIARYQNDSLLQENENSNLVKQLISNDKTINEIINTYNNCTLEYNQYITIFPNFIFAKRNGFVRKKFFTIKYGIENEDPIIKSKELPEWAKGVDDTL